MIWDRQITHRWYPDGLWNINMNICPTTNICWPVQGPTSPKSNLKNKKIPLNCRKIIPKNETCTKSENIEYFMHETTQRDNWNIIEMCPDWSNCQCNYTDFLSIYFREEVYKYIYVYFFSKLQKLQSTLDGAFVTIIANIQKPGTVPKRANVTTMRTQRPGAAKPEPYDHIRRKMKMRKKKE